MSPITDAQRDEMMRDIAATDIYHLRACARAKRRWRPPRWVRPPALTWSQQGLPQFEIRYLALRPRPCAPIRLGQRKESNVADHVVDQEFEGLKDELIEGLDTIIADEPRQIGVAMGRDLFRECVRRELIAIEELSVLRAGFLPSELPAYRGKHFAFVHPELGAWEFQVDFPPDGKYRIRGGFPPQTH